MIIQVEQLAKQFGKQPAVQGVSFQLQPKTCTALIGPNGAGKTTTLKMLAGILRPSAGTITFPEHDSVDQRKLIGYLPQYPSFYPWMSATEYLIHVAELCGLSKQEARDKNEQLLERVGLLDARKKRIGKFSGGMKQRLGIAQAMIHDPLVLLLDEPVASLDPIGRREVLEMMEHIKKDTAILYSTHVLHDAQHVSDHLLILSEGHVRFSGTMAELNDQYPLQKVTFSIADASPGSESVSVSDLEETLSEWEEVSQVNRNGNTFVVEMTDLESGRARLFRYMANHHLPIIHLEAGQASLEDLFLKVVQS